MRKLIVLEIELTKDGSRYREGFWVRPKSRKLIRMTSAVVSPNKHQGQKLTSRAYLDPFPATCIRIWHRPRLHLRMTRPFLLTEHDFVMLLLYELSRSTSPEITLCLLCPYELFPSFFWWISIWPQDFFK